jgi:glycosyltransferase involved in cell wall biosynthesis
VPSVRDRTIAVIPCLNEGATIGALVRDTRRWVERVVVVDDGSSDQTARAATEAGAVVERHESPRGKGAALATGWAVAAGLGAEWTLLLDGDGQHDPADAAGFFEAADAGARLVIGNRMPGAAAIPWLRRRTNRWMSRRISVLAGTETPDSQCGYRLVHVPALQRVALRCRRYEIESEMTVAFARAGLPISFVPIRVRYGGEQSRISPVLDTVRWFRWYLRARADGRLFHAGTRRRGD